LKPARRARRTDPNGRRHRPRCRHHSLVAIDWLVEVWDGWRHGRRERARLRQGKRACACCGHLTLQLDPGDYEICPICFWEDDPVQLNDPDFKPGANKVSLNEARENYRRLGVSEARFRGDVRPARPDEIPPG
jgi:Cysteine-rich CPCC